MGFAHVKTTEFAFESVSVVKEWGHATLLVVETPDESPTQRDVENARRRQEIAQKQNEKYLRCQLLALSALGPGYTPWMKLSLLESDHHRHPDSPVVGGVAYKVYRGEERLTENSVFLMEKDGKVLKARNPEELFGDLLQEKHKSYGFEKDGTWTAFSRWSICWAALELYNPKNARTTCSPSRKPREEENGTGAKKVARRESLVHHGRSDGWTGTAK